MKFNRIFSPSRIPYWGISHLLEELNICRPSRQRRLMFVLEQLLVYLPISEQRRTFANKHVVELDAYSSGSQSMDQKFSTLPIFPPLLFRGNGLPSQNPYYPRREVDNVALNGLPYRSC